MPALGAAGLSLTLASEASLAATALVQDTMTRKAAASHEIILREEETFDVSLATFYVFDKEKPGAFRAGERLIKVGWGSAGCVFACSASGQPAPENNAYSPPVPRPIRPAHQPIRKKW